MSVLWSGGKPAERTASAQPSRRSSSIDRALVVLHRGLGGTSRRASSTMLSTPRRARSMARVMPTGPAPAIRTGTVTLVVTGSAYRVRREAVAHFGLACGEGYTWPFSGRGASRGAVRDCRHRPERGRRPHRDGGRPLRNRGPQSRVRSVGLRGLSATCGRRPRPRHCRQPRQPPSVQSHRSLAGAGPGHVAARSRGTSGRWNARPHGGRWHPRQGGHAAVRVTARHRPGRTAHG